MSLAESYANRRVFVTGHTGFKGAWLAEWLGTLGAEVTGYALDPPTQPSLFDALGLAARLTHVVADVRDRDRLAAEVQAAQPSVIFHLAAQALVRQAVCRAARDLRDQRDGHRQRAGGGSRLPFGARGRHRHQRQVLPEPGGRPTLPRDGRHGRPRPVQRQQGQRRARHRGLPRELLRATARPSPPCAPATSSAPATGRPTGSSPTASGPWRPASPSSSGTPMPSGPGSTSWSRCPGTSGWRPSCCATATATTGPGTSDPPTRPVITRCVGWSSASSRSGARVHGPRRPIRGRSRTKPTG